MIIKKSISFFVIFSFCFFCNSLYSSIFSVSFDPTKLKTPVEEVRIIETLGKLKIEPTNPNHILVLRGNEIEGFSFGCKDGQFIIEGKEIAFYENPFLENGIPEIGLQPWSIEVHDNTFILKNCHLRISENLFVIAGNVFENQESLSNKFTSPLWQGKPKEGAVFILKSSN